MTGQLVPVFERNIWFGRTVISLRGFCANRGLVVPPVTIWVDEPESIGALGECRLGDHTRGRLASIAISPEVADGPKALAAVLHELVHASDDCASDDGEWFPAWALTLGLTQVPATVPNAGLQRYLQRLSTRLPAFPPSHTGFQVLVDGRVVA